MDICTWISARPAGLLKVVPRKRCEGHEALQPDFDRIRAHLKDDLGGRSAAAGASEEQEREAGVGGRVENLHQKHIKEAADDVAMPLLRGATLRFRV